jgi:ankyrin repeat protein
LELTVFRFLLAQLQLASLTGKRSPKAVRTALEKLPAGSDAYDHAYKEAMERIEGQVADSRELAKQILLWITCAKRRLTTLELRHALAVEISTSELDEENLPEIEDIVSVCAGLVTVDEKSNIIRLVHYTTQEYFERTQISWFPGAQRDIAATCVTYLSFDAFETGFCLTDEEFEARLQSNALYDYSARNWGHHARMASMEKPLILDLLESESKVSASTQVMIASKRDSWDWGYSQRVPGQMKGVHLAAYFGLREAIIALLEKGHDPSSTDTWGRTPLSWAARNGHEAAVKLLRAQEGVDPDSKDFGYGQTPLSLAAGNGHEAIVKLLLAQEGVNPDSKEFQYGQTPLLLAAGNGHEAVVKLLLAEEGVDPDSKDDDGRTPLWWASNSGQEAVVKLLLAQEGVDPDSKDSEYGLTPLSWAAAYGHEAVVKLLLAQEGVDLDSKDSKYGWTPLLWAEGSGNKSVVKLLQSHHGSK